MKKKEGLSVKFRKFFFREEQENKSDSKSAKQKSNKKTVELQKLEHSKNKKQNNDKNKPKHLKIDKQNDVAVNKGKKIQNSEHFQIAPLFIRIFGTKIYAQFKILNRYFVSVNLLTSNKSKYNRQNIRRFILPLPKIIYKFENSKHKNNFVKILKATDFIITTSVYFFAGISFGKGTDYYLKKINFTNNLSQKFDLIGVKLNNFINRPSLLKKFFENLSTKVVIYTSALLFTVYGFSVTRRPIKYKIADEMTDLSKIMIKHGSYLRPVSVKPFSGKVSDISNNLVKIDSVENKLIKFFAKNIIGDKNSKRINKIKNFLLYVDNVDNPGNSQKNTGKKPQNKNIKNDRNFEFKTISLNFFKVSKILATTSIYSLFGIIAGRGLNSYLREMNFTANILNKFDLTGQKFNNFLSNKFSFEPKLNHLGSFAIIFTCGFIAAEYGFTFSRPPITIINKIKKDKDTGAKVRVEIQI